MREIKVALIGTPNVGKSTVYNALTNNHVHTGNWAGKTVEFSKGTCIKNDIKYIFYDLPGTYSLISKSKEEVVTTDFIVKENFDVAVVVCDATSLEKGINLLLQVEELAKKVVLCINLIDEAEKKGIVINYELLSKNINCPLVSISAKKNIGLDKLLEKIKDVKEEPYLDIDYGILNKSIKDISNSIKDFKGNKKWLALRILENDKHYINLFKSNIVFSKNINLENLNNIDISLEIVIKIKKEVKKRLKGVITYKKDNLERERKIDKIITSKIFGIPIMLSILFILFYITIKLANYPSDFLFKFFQSLEDNIINILKFIHLPSNIISLLVDGVYKTLYWVISVMMPPMLIFFPLFSLLEDLGLLPRIAFNIDKFFCKCKVSGKQALTMCMGIGCNAVGVTNARIIDSKRERIIAILTNVFMPCNGKFPTLIAIISMFMGSMSHFGSLISALILTSFIFIGIIITFIISFILSKFILKGETSSFTLELPPYRVPKILESIIRSIKDKALSVLIRAIKVSIPTGAIIWCVANIHIGNLSIMEYLITYLNPVGNVLGLDGVIILALLLGFPANEIVVPVMLMGYLKTNTLIEYNSLDTLKNILIMNGWNIKMAISFILLMMFHYPCSTTLLTIKKETNSLYYTILAFLIPLLVGIILCLIINIF